MGRNTVLAAALAVLMASTTAMAMDNGQHAQRGHGQMMGISDLTADQKTKLKAIGAAQNAEVKPVHEQARERIKELKALVEAKAGDEAIKAKLAELTKIRETLKVLREKYMDQREQVFTPTQRANMALKMEDRKSDGRGEKTGMKGKKAMKCGKGEAPETEE